MFPSKQYKPEQADRNRLSPFLQSISSSPQEIRPFFEPGEIAEPEFVRHLTPEETEDFHLSTLRLTYEEAVREYRKRACTPIGRLLANRELPVLARAKAMLDTQ